MIGHFLIFLFLLGPGVTICGISCASTYRRIRALWADYERLEQGQLFRARVGEALRAEEARASYALTSVVRRWQELAHDKWVGTALEEDYFYGSPRPEAVRLLDAVNVQMDRAEVVARQLQVPIARVGAERRLQEIMEADLITLEMEKLLTHVLE